MNFHRTILKNGLRLVTVPMKDNPTVTVLVLVEAGSKYETKEINGISHFLEHMCFKGTTKRPKSIDISRELDAVGAQYNAFTSQEFTGYYAKVDARHLAKALDVVSDLYQNPTLPEAEIEREKGVVIEEINMYQDLPQRHVHDVFLSLLYGDQPAGWDVTGTRETVRALTREKILSYRTNHYVSGATTLVVAGNFDEKSIAANVESAFSHMSSGEKHGKTKVVEAQVAPVVKVEYKKTDQTHLVIGVRTFDTYDPRNPALRVLTGVLGGGMSARLFQKLREEMGVAYYVSANAESSTDHGYLGVATGVPDGRLTEVIRVLIGEFKRFRDEEVSPEELRKAKDHLVGSLNLGLETSDAVAEFYGLQEILRKNLKTPTVIAEEIERVSAEDIRRLAGEIFVNQGLNLALIGPSDDSGTLSQLLTF